MKRPSDLVYADSAAYVGQFAPKKRATILDVGCGSGGLAAALGKAGFAVTPIDVSEDAVKEARANGIQAQQADLLTFEGGPYDIVLFSFALHHIFPLNQAVEKARALLASGGRVILEEFARDRIDAATAAWFFGTQDVLRAAGLLGNGEPSGVLDGREPLERWKERFAPGRHGHHGGASKGAMDRAVKGRSPSLWSGDGRKKRKPHGREGHGHFSHDLHGGEAMRAAIAARFKILHEERTPALARFWLHRMREDAMEVARQLVPMEQLLIAQGMIQEFGFRIVAANG